MRKADYRTGTGQNRAGGPRHRHGVAGMPLSLAGTGEMLRVVEIRAGRALTRRLADMGLIPGVGLKVVNRQESGPVLIDLKGSRLALGYGMAHRIIVEEGQDEG